MHTHPFDQAPAFANWWQDLLQTKVHTAKGRKQAPSPHHKAQAFRAFCKSVRSYVDHEKFLAATHAYRHSERVSCGYVQDASTFVNSWREWEPPVEAQEAIVADDDETARSRVAAEFHRPRVEAFIAEYGDPERSVSARELFNEWAGSRGDGGIFADWENNPARDFWTRWKELSA